MPVEPFQIHIDDAVLDDLAARLRHTRWPDPAPGEPWSQGTDLAYLRDLVAYWADGFDWSASSTASTTTGRRSTACRSTMSTSVVGGCRSS
jgi:hypothetical protein